MGWFDKVPKLKAVVEKEKTNRSSMKTRALCIHGDDNCIRCAAEDFDLQGEEKTSWQTLDAGDLRRIVVSLPTKAREALRRNPGKVVLAGGYIRALIANEHVHDVDLFVNSEKDAKLIANSVKMLYKVDDQHLAIDLKGVPVQMVWRYPFKAAYDILDQFDFTVTKAAIWFAEGEKGEAPGFRSICHESFYRDLARKLLVYTSKREHEQFTGFPRLLKYTSYGYTIGPKSFAEVIVKLCLSLDFEKGFEGLLAQLEAAYKSEGSDEEWTKLNAKYVKPKSKPKPSYDWGS